MDNVLYVKESEDHAEVLDSFSLCPNDGTVGLHSAVTAAELTNTASTDLPFILRLEFTSNVKYWPGK